MNWLDHAACRGVDTDLFYPTAEGSDGHKATQRVIVEYCNACPVRAACLAHALEHRETQGVWGGMAPGDRAVERIRLHQKSA